MKNYFKHKLTNLISISKIVTIHHFVFEKTFHTTGEAHDFWEIVYVEKGSLLCKAESRDLQVKQGEMLFHKPGEFHALAVDGKSAPSVFILCFVCRSEAMRFFEDRKITLSPNLAKFVYSILAEGRKTFNIRYSDPKLKKMELLPSPTLGGEQLIKNYLEIFLINLLREQTATADGNATFLPWKELSAKPINEVTAFLRENVCVSLTIEQICRKTAYSKAYLFRVFKEKTGKTIMHYFMELKIERAKQLLKENELSVREISESLAFNTPDYFTKVFKRFTGLTPLAYKRRSTGA